MTTKEEHFEARKQQIIKGMFVDTADNNYIVSRWCWYNRRFLDFFWLSLHSLEKYYKASLLLNSCSAKGYNHDLEKLHERLKEIASDLIPDQLDQPPSLQISHWHNQSTIDLIKSLNELGSANNRYQIEGYRHFGDYVHKVDAMVFFIRRLCISLSAMRTPQQSWSDYLRADEGFWRLHASGTLETAVEGRHGVPVQAAVCNLNCHFAPNGYNHEPHDVIFSMAEPPLRYALLAPARTASIGTPEADAAQMTLDWVLNNINIGGSAVERDLKRLFASAQQGG